MTDRLKSCPLCDGEAEWKNGHIICKKCGLRFRDFSYDLTNKKWNTRKPMDRIVERLESEISSNRKLIPPRGGKAFYEGTIRGLRKALKIVKEGSKNV